VERPNLIWHLRIQASWIYVLEREAGHALHFDVVSQERMLQAGILSTGADRAMMTRSHETFVPGAPVQAGLGGSSATRTLAGNGLLGSVRRLRAWIGTEKLASHPRIFPSRTVPKSPTRRVLNSCRGIRSAGLNLRVLTPRKRTCTMMASPRFPSR
jgi:hypothetical protein